MDMSFEKLFDFVFKELEVVEYNPCKHLYQTRYDSVLEKLKEAAEKDGWKVDWVSEDKDYIRFYVREDFEKQCCDILDKLNNRMISEEEMNEICKTFPDGSSLFSNGPFYIRPKLIEKIEDLVECLEEYCDDDPITKAFHLARYWKDRRPDIDLFYDRYWFYIEGTNWELEIDTQSGLLKYIECVISNSEIEEQEKTLKVLKKLEECN